MDSHFILDGKIIINPFLSEQYSSKSPYLIDFENRKLVLYKKKVPHCLMDIIPAPQWYFKKTSDGIFMSDVLRLHGHSVLADAKFSRCDFFNSGKGCLFCSFPKNKIPEKSKILWIKETIRTALEENKKYSIGLSEGGRFTQDRGAIYLSKIVSSIREVDDAIPISVELIPPKINKYLDPLIDSGVTSLIMNLEFYDESIRRLFCPGKSRIIKKRYFDAFSYAIDKLKPGNVSSVLIAGIERTELTLEGAEKMVELGVIPTIIPFKPYDSCYLKNFHLTDSIRTQIYCEAPWEIIKEIFSESNTSRRMY